MTLTKVKLERFTAFADLEVQFSPGINAFIGVNGAGKTHLMKVCYAACDVSNRKKQDSFAEKLVRVFLPSGRTPGRLVKRQKGRSGGTVSVHRGNLRLQASFSTLTRQPGSVKVAGVDLWRDSPVKTVYIPAKDMLANAPGFQSLYAMREVHFEEVYADILERAYLPPLRGPMDKARRRLGNILHKAIQGKATVKDGEFFLRNRQGNLEFTLLAEGTRKLGLLWILVQNGTLQNGSVLFWDEPETNLNPTLFGTVIEVLMELQRAGVQVFFATHDYVILKELDLQKKDGDAVAFHSLYRDETGEVACHTTGSYLDIHPNAIDETFDDLYDREIERSMGSHSK